MSDTQELAAAKPRLWSAVDAITKPSTHRVPRAHQEVDVAGELLADLASNPTRLMCSVLEKQRADQLAADQTLAYGQVPSLWLQATWAVFGSEAGDGSGGKTSARERSPADLDLMETLLTIRESLGWQLPGRKVAWRKPGDIPDMMRQFASHIVTHEPQHVEWWAFRFEQWGRLLRNHLNALDNGPRPVHLRGAVCPLCRCSQVFVTDTDDGPSYEPATPAECKKDGTRKVAPALKVDFVDGHVRAAQCLACGHTWWRGTDLEGLARELDDTPQTA